MWRQGDVLVQSVSEIPAGLQRVKRLVVASGDNTAYRHQIKDRASARLFTNPQRFDNEMFLEVMAEQAKLEHPEHGTITLGRGCYRVWRQREFTDHGSRSVYD